MTESIQRKTLFCRTDQQSTQGYVERRDYTLKERLTRTLRISGVLFAGAVGSVFVPILHFVLVPVLLLCSAVFGVATWIDRGEILRGEFPCPQCQKLNTLARASESFPSTTRCQHCYFTVKLDVKP